MKTCGRNSEVSSFVRDLEAIMISVRSSVVRYAEVTDAEMDAQIASVSVLKL